MAKKTTKKTSNASITLGSWEPPKVTLTEEKATKLADLMKDKGIEYHMGSSLKSQVEAFMQGMSAAKKSKGASK